MARETCTALALVPATPPTPQPAAAVAAAAAVPGGGAASTTALAPGFRFHPTDEELVSYYLKRKVGNKPVRFNAISEVDIYKNEPWELADKSRLKSRDQEWYFFSALDKKYGNGARMNRATGRGYWKATGKDREIRRDNQLIAMKKTLVFHSGRAPGGQRTNWVMHEYRLVEELERSGNLQGDSYVLCRVFHKNNIGPPSGNRYAPFMEEEWDDGQAALVPGEDAVDEVVACNGAYAEMNHVEQDKYRLSKEPFDFNEVPKQTRDLLSLCKNESVEMAEDTPMCVLNTEAQFPLIQYKRRKHNDYDSNGSDQSTRTTQDLSSSTTTTATTTATTDTTMTTTAATTTAISALLEFSLMEPKEITHPPPSTPKEPTFTAANLESLIPSGCMKFINDLQREVHKVSVERETLKLDLMSSQAMINILQSRIDVLNKENEDLKRGSLREGK